MQKTFQQSVTRLQAIGCCLPLPNCQQEERQGLSLPIFTITAFKRFLFCWMSHKIKQMVCQHIVSWKDLRADFNLPDLINVSSVVCILLLVQNFLGCPQEEPSDYT